jgi:hypothetical protein
MTAPKWYNVADDTADATAPLPPRKTDTMAPMWTRTSTHNDTDDDDNGDDDDGNEYG